MSTWGIQVGLLQGDPLLLTRDGSHTMRIDKCLRFSSKEEAEKRCVELNSGPPQLRPTAEPVDLNALAEEHQDDE